MGLESATYISELVATNPVGAVDDYATADDHLRLIKLVLQGQFPNFTAVAMNASVVELNLLVGLTAAAAELNTLDGFTGVTADLNVLAGAAAGGLTAAELLFMAGVTSDVQAQLNGKAPTSHSHGTAGIDNDAITLAKIQNIVTDSFIGRTTAGTGDPESLTAGMARTVLNVENNAAADQSGGEIEAIVNHDNLIGFAGDEHVAHAGVSITAGIGLSGGGNISSTRTVDLATNTLTDLAGIPTRLMSMPVYTGSVMRRVDMEDLNRIIERTFATNSTLVIGDEFGVVRSTSASPTSMTIPPNASVAFPLGTVIGGEQHGAGKFSWVAGAAVIIRSADGNLGHRTQYSATYLRKLATDTWLLAGDLIA